MEKHIVHIYRRDEVAPQRIAGTVENVTKREKIEFQSFADLMKILCTLPRDAEYRFRAE